MKVGLVICGPDVAYGPLALLSGTFEEKVQKARVLGYDGVELMVRDPAELDWPHLRHTLERTDLEVPQIVTGELFGADGLCLVTPDEDLHQRALLRTQSVIDLAAYLDHAIVNVGRLRGRLDWLVGYTEDPWSFAVERIAEITAYAAARNVPIALEPINRYETDFIANVDDGMRMIAAVGAANLGLMLDVFHMNIEDVSIEDSLKRAGQRCLHVHIADSNRRYPGAGHLDFVSIFAALRNMGYLGYISAELFPWPDPDTAAAKTIAYIRTVTQESGQ